MTGVQGDFQKALSKLEAFSHLKNKKRVFNSTSALLKEIL